MQGSFHDTAYVRHSPLTLFIQLAADSELSVKNGAELLDRLVKDIVSESAATYVSVLEAPEQAAASPGSGKGSRDSASVDLPTAFSLAKFIPLLQERIHVINPFTRTFLVSWVTLLDTIPDLELVHYLPAFLGGLFRFLSDANRDVHVATQGALERFLNEIKRIARIRKGLAESRKEHSDEKDKRSSSSDSASIRTDQSDLNEKSEAADGEYEGQNGAIHGDWVPGQDVVIDHSKILEILVSFLDSPSGTSHSFRLECLQLTQTTGEELQLTALRWINIFFEICPEDILAFIPRLLAQVLPAMASGSDVVRQAANRVNNSLMDQIAALPEEPNSIPLRPAPPVRVPTNTLKESDAVNKGSDSSLRPSPSATPNATQTLDGEVEMKKEDELRLSTPPPSTTPDHQKPVVELDYSAAVNALTLHFLNEHEATRVAALSWLIMLHRRAPRKVLATNEGTFPALLKTLSDPAEAVVTRDLQLLSQISKNSEDGYFTSFMNNLLQLFSTDRKLLETRGNLIIRQLCVSLSAERIYRTLADCLERDEVRDCNAFRSIVLNSGLLRMSNSQASWYKTSTTI